MPNCNVCGKESPEEICSKCLNDASQGTYSICVRCNKISNTFIIVPNGPDDIFDTKKRLYTTLCRSCNGNLPTQMYEIEKEALNKL